MTTIDVPALALNAVLNMLARHVPDREIRVMGSRVSGRAKSFSDLDLVVMGDGPLDLRTLGQLRDAFDESNLPFAVDIVEWGHRRTRSAGSSTSRLGPSGQRPRGLTDSDAISLHDQIALIEERR